MKIENKREKNIHFAGCANIKKTGLRVNCQENLFFEKSNF